MEDFSQDQNRVFLEKSHNEEINHDDDDDDEDDIVEDKEVDDNAIQKSDNMSLTAIFDALQIDNIWASSVPAQYISIVFRAAHKKIIRLDQAVSACNMYATGNDFARSVWHVFELQQDSDDFIDSIVRISRNPSKSTEASSSSSLPVPVIAETEPVENGTNQLWNEIKKY